MTRLAFIADKVLEWMWLAAIVFAPLFFNVYSSRVFEPDKLSIIRTIALFAALAWAVKLIEQMTSPAAAAAKEERNPNWWRVPLLIPILLYAAWYLLTSLASVTPIASIFGSYQRLQGLFSQYAYIIIALAIVFNVRTRAQVERIITFAIATALPVAAYCFLQASGSDPLPWAGDVETRVASSMGNAIFVGAWLIMVMPLILYRIASIAYRLFNREDGDLEREMNGDDWLMVLGYAVTALVQLLVFWFALSQIAANQKPDFRLWFILPTAILIFYLLNFVYGTARRSSRVFAMVQLVAMVALLAAVITAIFLTKSRGPLAGMVAALVLFGFGLLAFLTRRRWLLNLGGAGVAGIFALMLTAPFISDIIRAVPGLNQLDPEKIPFLGQGRESTTAQVRKLIWEGAIGLISSDPIRTFIGYGPESMYVAYNRFYPADLAHVELRNATPDRSHNVILDQLINGGFIMLALYLFMIATFFFYCWKAINRSQSFSSKVLILALASGVAAHIIEVAVGIQIAATYTYFYTYMGLMIAFTVFVEKVLVPAERTVVEERAVTNGPVTAMNRVMAALMPQSTLVGVAAGGGGSNIMLRQNSGGSGSRAPRSSRTARTGGTGGAVEPTNGTDGTNSSNGDGNGVTGSAAKINRTPASSSNPAAPLNRDMDRLAQVAKADPRTVRPAQPQTRRPNVTPTRTAARPVSTAWFASPVNLLIYGVIAVVILFLSFSTNFNLVHADMLYKQGLSADNQAAWPQSVQLYQQALSEQPDQDYYYLFMGRAFMEWSKAPQRYSLGAYTSVVDPAGWNKISGSQQQQALRTAIEEKDVPTARNNLILKAEQTLETAKRISPKNTDHYANLARLYLYWGGQVNNDPAILMKGVENFRTATTLSPQNAQLWNERAQAERGYALLVQAIADENAKVSTPVSSTNTISNTGTTNSGGVVASGTPTTTTAPKADPEARKWLEEAEKSIRHTIDSVDPIFGNSYPIWLDIERGLDNPQLAQTAIISGTLIDSNAMYDNASEVKDRMKYFVDKGLFNQVRDGITYATTPRTEAEQAEWARLDADFQRTRDFVKIRDTSLYWKGGQAKTANAYNLLGYLHWVNNDLPASAEALEKSIALNGSQYNTMRLLVGHYNTLNRPQDELRLLNRMLALLNDSNALNNLFQGDQQGLDAERTTLQQRVQSLGGGSAPAPAPAAPPPGVNPTQP